MLAFQQTPSSWLELSSSLYTVIAYTSLLLSETSYCHDSSASSLTYKTLVTISVAIALSSLFAFPCLFLYNEDLSILQYIGNIFHNTYSNLSLIISLRTVSHLTVTDLSSASSSP
mmetsp:Transcript_20821/g.41405  ORF Transcript_20821/g.41405 Transcript_20821/m.41405 type:complete len:115 (-) Transcript_20821:146-490(-)